MHQFSRKSKKEIKSCHDDLGVILNTAIKVSYIDFGVSQGHRTLEQQREFYKRGLSKIDGLNSLSKHNYSPSMAVDIYGYVNGKISYDYNDMCYLAGVITSCAKILKNSGVIKHNIRWGGNWDMDGVIIKDQSFQDLCHFELV